MAESVLNQEEHKTRGDKGKISDIARSAKTKRILGLVLSVLMIALTMYVLKLHNENTQILQESNELALNAGVSQAANYRSYVKQYKDTKAQLEETTLKLEAVTSQLNEVTAELAATKSLLAQTQEMLNQATAENNKLKEDIMSLDGSKPVDGTKNIADMQAKVTALKAKNNETSKELESLKLQLRAFQADFSTLEEGRSLIALFQNKIKLVKTRMRYLSQEAYFAKIAAQKERDRLALLNGNNGYLMQNGQSQSHKAGNKKFSIDVKMMQ